MKTSSGAGSLDMLLDTMCNTFGGVCFIALMVAIISASLPSGTDADAEQEAITEQMVIDKETARLVRERDELKAAIEIQKAFVATNTSDGMRALSVAQLASGISSNANMLAKLKKEKLELEDKLAKLTTDVAFSSREAMRLARLLKDMEERIDAPINMKSRVVRTPVERELGGYKPLDVWLRNGRLYDLNNEYHVNRTTIQGGKEWYYRIRPNGGYLLDDAFYASSEYRQLINMLDYNSGKMFMRIFSDAASFPHLCALRDDLIRRRKLYNWYAEERDELFFVEGYDGKVQ